MDKYQKAFKEEFKFECNDENVMAFKELVERATPKKVIPNSCVNVAGNCPACNEIIEEGHEYRFHVDEGKIGSCPNPECRQALDWTD